jgi:hypothetical protein
MAWYAAHVILYFRRQRKRQSRFLVWENIVLIQAATEEEAFAKATKRGQEDAEDNNGGIRFGDEPAELVFGGVRKLVLCQDEDRRPKDGTEVSYIEMEVRSEEALRKLIEGEPVSATIVDRFPDEPAAAPTAKDRSA